MNKKTKMRLLSILLCVVMVVSLMPTTVFAAQQQISAVEATSPNIDTIPTLYGTLKIPSFTITQGSPTYITASDANLRWQKNIGGVWTNQEAGRFTPGEWRISTSLRLDDDGALQYDFAQNLTFEVNGNSWTVETPNNHGEYSFAWVYSPAFTIVDDPNVQPPVPVESVHIVLNGYTSGAAAASATVTTDANVTVEVLGFLVAIDSNGDGQPDATEPVTGNFESGKMYAVALRIKAKSGYDISELTMGKVTLDRALTPVMGQYNSEEDIFAGMCMLSDATQYTVNFETNGGSAIQSETVDGGTKVTKPAIDPTYAGHVFAGWYSDAGLTTPFDFANTVITGDTTIYAKWDVVITAANATVTVPVAGEHPDFNPISGDSSRYTVAFETWYLHESPYPDLDANSVFEHGKYYSLRIRFTPNAGYQFDSNTVFTVNGKATASFGGIGAREYSATAYAATYTVTYDANGGTGSMAQEFLTHDNDGFAKNYTFPQCGFTSPAGQEFDKWLWYYESNPGSTNEITPGQSPWIYGNIVVKALWKTAEYNVTVTGGTASVGAGTPITKATMGTTVTLIAGQAPAGQEFDKWVVNGVVVADANSATTTFVMPAGEVTATATYKDIPVVTYTVTFDSAGGSAVTAQTIEAGQKATKPADPTKSGYDFKGWTLNGSAYDFNTAVNGDITLVATWEQQQVVPTTYTVSFAANGGTGTMADVTGISGDYTLPSNGFTAPDGKQFKTWSVGGVEKAVGDKITVTADTTVTAVWEDLPPVHVCELTPISKVEPSCVDGGKKAYYKCLGCGKAFEDELGSVLIADIDAWGNIEKTNIHKDEDGDGKCDKCRSDVENGLKPPKTGDNGIMWLWLTLVVISGLGIMFIVYGKKAVN